ncbi:MAG: hypothetical protein RL662_973 [Bacteroidota bacterium]|jgi:putative transposase
MGIGLLLCFENGLTTINLIYWQVSCGNRLGLGEDRNQKPLWEFIDSQSVKWSNNKALNGIDGNKKVKGIKRHVVVDKNGFLIAVMITVANINDNKTAMLLMCVLEELCSSIKTSIADGRYRG